MTLTITSLRVDYRNTEGWFDGGARPCPYAICNIVFKCERSNDYGEDYAWWQAKAFSEEYRKVLTIDDPERYEAWLNSAYGFGQFKYPGYGRAWTHEDPTWQYIPKFDVFWLREWIADCTVTRAVIAELEYFKENGKLPSVYRSTDESVVLSHLRTLSQYWD
jgi:hypothetical protein